jgi:nicotinamidase-related amidase
MLIRHPLTLLTRAVPAIELVRGHTCLLLQDLHAPFADAEAGWLATWARQKVLLREFDEYYDALDLVAPNMAKVVMRVRALGLPVVYSCLGHVAPSPPSPLQEAMGWLWELGGEAGRFPPAWSPQPDDVVFAKPGWGACGNPDFVAYLHARNIRSMIVMGTMLDLGIRQTCAELSERGVQPLVVSDGVVALTAVGRAFTGGSMAHGMTKLRSTGELLDLLTTLAEKGHVLV